MITFNPPLNVVLPNRSLTVKELHLVIIDVERTKVCKIQSAPFYKTVTLWEGQDYDNIGDYTQAQAEAKFLELLGSDPASELAKLYVEPPVRNS